MNKRTVFSTQNQWENKYGYARMNIVGDLVFLGGTVAVSEDPTQVLDAGEQTRRCYEIIEHTLDQAGLDRSSIVRSRCFVTHIQRDHDSVGCAHKEFFGDHQPCLTMVEVSKLIDDSFLVEIECDAVRGLSGS